MVFHFPLKVVLCLWYICNSILPQTKYTQLQVITAGRPKQDINFLFQVWETDTAQILPSLWGHWLIKAALNPCAVSWWATHDELQQGKPGYPSRQPALSQGIDRHQAEPTTVWDPPLSGFQGTGLLRDILLAQLSRDIPWGCFSFNPAHRVIKPYDRGFVHHSATRLKLQHVERWALDLGLALIFPCYTSQHTLL